MKRARGALGWLRHWRAWLGYDSARDPFNRYADSQARAAKASIHRLTGNFWRDLLMGEEVDEA